MRGRCILKETSAPSLCAFCAHRLGQTNVRKSTTQRRFIHSSPAARRPPAEATAIKSVDDDVPPRPSWGSGSGGIPGRGPVASTFGRSVGGIPPRPGGGFGGGFGSAIPAGRGGIPPGKSTSGGDEMDYMLPHEIKAREMMVAETERIAKAKRDREEEIARREAEAVRAKAEAVWGEKEAAARRLEAAEERRRSMNSWGNERDNWREGRPAARRGWNSREDNENARRAYNTRDDAQQRQFERRETGPVPVLNGPVRRMIGTPPGPAPISDSRSQNPSPVAPAERIEGIPIRSVQASDYRSQATPGGAWFDRRDGYSPYSDAASFGRREDNGIGESSWGQLRTRPRAQEPPTRTPNPFAESRAQREEQAKLGKYTPLGGIAASLGPWARDSGSNAPAQKPPPSTREQETQATSWKPMSAMPSREPQRQSSLSNRDAQSASWGSMPPSRESEGPSSSITRQAPEVVKATPERKMTQEEEDEEEWEMSRRQAKGKKARGRTEDVSYTVAPKGKDRDKAKRREQFSRSAEDDLADEEASSRAEAKRLRKEEKKAARKAAKEAEGGVPILLPEFISVSNLSIALRVRFEEFVEKMEDLGFDETAHDYILNSETSGLIAMEYGFEPMIDRGDGYDLKAREPAADPSIIPPRSPVVTIMGHVDHGKTTLLDYLRKSSVAAGEHGGITQHIGAFSVPMPSGKVITFLDTPGHAAFLSMRQRGANVTDIVILVVAADDSVKPQTIEAINHAKAAKVPIIVAINKIDKEDSNIEKVKQDLARHGVDVEDFGGDTQVVCVSGKTGQGMDELEEAAVALSELLDMRAEIDGQAEGWVIEASIKSMGKVATVLVRRGTMRPGDFIVAGKTWARIRCMRNEAGVEIEEAGPGMPVEIDGWREQPLAGDEVLQAPDEAKAKSVIDFRLEKEERDKLAEDMEAINEVRKINQEKQDREKAEAAALKAALKQDKDFVPEEIVRPTKAGGPKQIYFIIKGDVSGSVEAVIDSIAGLGNNEVRPHILRSGVGQLSEFDIEHAAAAKGILINFNTPVEPHISRLAEDAKVAILDHNIIYKLVDDVRAELSKNLPPLITQKVLGEAEIAKIFSINIKKRIQKPIAGCKVRNGTISKVGKIRVLRGGENIFDGALETLKNGKKAVAEMKKGGECGIEFAEWIDFQVGDQIQSYEEISEKRFL